MNRQEKKTYTNVSLVLEFLRGNKHFFILSILTSMVVAGLEMISPQLIRVTVDSIIGDRPIELPSFAIHGLTQLAVFHSCEDIFG